MNFAEREIARIIANTGKLSKNSVLISTEKLTTQNVYYRLPYLISYLWFRLNGVLIFRGGLGGVRYQTPKNRSESCETKFVSVRPKYLSDRTKIFIASSRYERMLPNFVLQASETEIVLDCKLAAPLSFCRGFGPRFCVHWAQNEARSFLPSVLSF